MCYYITDFNLIALKYLGPFPTLRLEGTSLYIHIITLLLVLFCWLLCQQRWNISSNHTRLAQILAVYKKQVNVLLLRTSQAVPQMKRLLGVRCSVLRVMHHLMESGGTSYSRMSTKLERRFTQREISEETRTGEEEKATDAPNLDKWWRSVKWELWKVRGHLESETMIIWGRNHRAILEVLHNFWRGWYLSL